MIPILYPATETQFRSNGLGALKDVMSCEVHEVLNGEYELTMEYPVTGQHFEDIEELCLILAKPSASEDPQPFEIYKVGSEIGGIVTIYAQHISYRLSMIPVKPFTASSPTEAILKLNQYAVYTVPFTITADTQKTGELKIENPMSARAVIGEIIKKYDLEVKWSMFSVHMSDRRGADNGVTISYGKNLTELQHESDLSETITGVLPYWSGMSNSGTSSQTIKLVGDVVLDETHDPLYPYHRVVPYDFSNWFGEGVVPSLSDLQTAGQQYLANYHTGLPKEQMDASFIPLWLTEEFKQKASVERVSIGDTIRIVASKINVDARARIVEATWNVLKERYDDLVTGKARNGLSEQFNAVTEKVEETTNAIKTDLQTAIDKATDMITGNNGGYIKFMYDADGKPYEMLVMDNEDMEQAENVWRFNQSGFGHSSTGYNGPYTTAITQDGKIVADFITAGTLNANVIKAGILSDGLGINYWNMQTGEFSLSQQNVYNSLTGGRTSGIYLQNGELKINADYIQAGQLNANRLWLEDWMRITFFDPEDQTTYWVGQWGAQYLPWDAIKYPFGHSGSDGVGLVGIFSSWAQEDQYPYAGVAIDYMNHDVHIYTGGEILLSSSNGTYINGELDLRAVSEIIAPGASVTENGSAVGTSFRQGLCIGGISDGLTGWYNGFYFDHGICRRVSSS